MNSEDRANGNVAANVLDGDPATFWHTRWQPQSDPLPHELVIHLGREMPLRGITYLPRQDSPNGRVGQYRFAISNDRKNWTTVAEGRFPSGTERQVVTLKEPVRTRYLRFVALSELSDQNFTSVAEIDIAP